MLIFTSEAQIISKNAKKLRTIFEQQQKPQRKLHK